MLRIQVQGVSERSEARSLYIMFIAKTVGLQQHMHAKHIITSLAACNCEAAHGACAP